MAATDNTQTRGICQCCGREQAVLADGRIAKHGYEVKDRGDGGWFKGVCSGQHHKPMQQDRAQADRIIAVVRRDVAELKSYLAALKTGKTHPAMATIYGRNAKGATIMVPFDTAEAWPRMYDQRGPVVENSRRIWDALIAARLLPKGHQVKRKPYVSRGKPRSIYPLHQLAA